MLELATAVTEDRTHGAATEAGVAGGTAVREDAAALAQTETLLTEIVAVDNRAIVAGGVAHDVQNRSDAGKLRDCFGAQDVFGGGVQHVQHVGATVVVAEANFSDCTDAVIRLIGVDQEAVTQGGIGDVVHDAEVVNGTGVADLVAIGDGTRVVFHLTEDRVSDLSEVTIGEFFHFQRQALERGVGQHFKARVVEATVAQVDCEVRVANERLEESLELFAVLNAGGLAGLGIGVQHTEVAAFGAVVLEGFEPQALVDEDFIRGGQHERQQLDGQVGAFVAGDGKPRGSSGGSSSG